MGYLYCEEFAPARVHGIWFLPLLLDKAVISQFGLDRSARERRTAVLQPDMLTRFVFGLGALGHRFGPVLADKQRITMDRETSAPCDAVNGNEMTGAKKSPHQRTLDPPKELPRDKQPMALFARLPDDLLTRLFTKARTLDLPAKAELFSAGAPGDECYRVEKGSLKVSVISKNGTERTLSIAGPNSVIGELSMLDGRPRSAAVTALTDCRLKYITRLEFQRFAAEVPAIYEHLTKLLAGMVRHTDDSIAAGAFLSNEGRLAWAFLQLAQGFGKSSDDEGIVIRLKLSQADIGSLAGISREHASRILNKWMRQGILARIDSYYMILATERLEQIAQM